MPFTTDGLIGEETKDLGHPEKPLLLSSDCWMGTGSQDCPAFCRQGLAQTQCWPLEPSLQQPQK